MTFFGSAGTDHFTGGVGNDVFLFLAADLAASDIVKGGGNDELKQTSAGNIPAGASAGSRPMSCSTARAMSSALPTPISPG
ncbi:MAG: hypothetical protein ACREFH_14035 [Stellaceae bacterium]